MSATWGIDPPNQNSADVPACCHNVPAGIGDAMLKVTHRVAAAQGRSLLSTIGLFASACFISVQRRHSLRSAVLRDLEVP